MNGNLLDIAFAGIARQAELLRAGELTAPQLTELYLERIERLNPRLNAFNCVFVEGARAEAAAAQLRLDAGESAPLLGVPVAVKDNIDIAGHVASIGTRGFSKPAAQDAEIVRKLRAAGAVIIGTTNLPEFAMYAHFTASPTWGVTRNPWNPERASGGSSGGSAVAVAAGLVGAAVASDGGGSIRVPAAFCGLFGLKPQRGRVSLMPHAQNWTGLSVEGSVTRSVADSALFLDVVAGNVAGDGDAIDPPAKPYVESAAETPPKLRVGVSMIPALPGTPIDSEVRDAVAATGDLFGRLGHEVTDAKLRYPLLLPLFLPRYLTGIADDAQGADERKLSARSRQAIKFGRSELAQKLRRRSIEHEDTVRAKLAPLFRRYDVLLTPTCARQPDGAAKWLNKSLFRSFPVAGFNVAFTVFWNYTGQPAASVPAGFARDGMPLAVQLVGPAGSEGLLLALAAQLERERPWADDRPPLANK